MLGSLVPKWLSSLEDEADPVDPDRRPLVIPDDNGLLAATITYLAITLVLVLLYMLLIRKGVSGWLFSPRGPTRFSETFNVGKFSGFEIKQMEFISRCGMDAYLTMRSIRLMSVIMLGYLVCGAAILIPAYRFRSFPERCLDFCQTGTHNHSDPFKSDQCICTIVDRFSLANIPKADSGLWFATVGMAICTVLTLFLLGREYRTIVRIRAAYWVARPSQIYSVVVDDIPAHLDLHTVQGLRDHFESLFPGQLTRVDAVRFADEEIENCLRRVGSLRMAAYDKLTRLQALKVKYGESHGGIPSCYSCFLNQCCTDLDVQIEKETSNLEDLNKEFEELLQANRALAEEEATGKLNRPVTSAFVTFNSAKAAAVASQVVLDYRYNVVTSTAPEPDDVRWEALGFGEKSRSCGSYTARFTFAFLVIFWGALTSFVAALTSVDALENEFESLHKFFNQYPRVKTLAEQSAPLLLSALVAVVNPLVGLLARVEAFASESDSEQVATVWYFYFLVTQVFIFFGVTGSLVKSVHGLIDNPSMIIELLSTNIPKNASFYIQFILTKFVTSLCLDLYRVSDLFLSGLRRMLFGEALSERDKVISRCGMMNISFPSHRNLHSLNAQLLLVFFIATTYAVIQPLIVPAAFMFFVMAYFVYGRLFMTVNEQRFDSGGTMWPRTYWCLVSALFTAQLTLVGVLGLRKGFSQSSMVLLIFFATIFAAAMIDFRYKKLILQLPLDLAAQVDITVGSEPTTEAPASVFQYDQLTLDNTPNYAGLTVHLERAVRGSNILPSYGTSSDEPERGTYFSYQLPVFREKPALVIPQTQLHTVHGSDNIHDRPLTPVGRANGDDNSLDRPLLS